jgi:hypothetical protein
MKMNMQLPDLVPKTCELLRFNILSRKATEINSKATKNEATTKYLSKDGQAELQH